MSIDYDQLNTGEANVKLPSDGPRVAFLDRASLVDTRSGEQVVTEWRDAKDYTCQWQSWNRFEGAGFQYTRDLLVGLGVPLGKTSSDGLPLIMDDESLRREIDIAVGGMFNVKTTSRQGDGRVFVNTYVDGLRTGGVQLDIEDMARGNIRDEPDVPIDTAGLPEPSSGPLRAAPSPGAQPPAPARGGPQTGAQSATGAPAAGPPSEPLPWEDDRPPF
jgi:hypothetical protein